MQQKTWHLNALEKKITYQIHHSRSTEQLPKRGSKLVTANGTICAELFGPKSWYPIFWQIGQRERWSLSWPIILTGQFFGTVGWYCWLAGWYVLVERIPCHSVLNCLVKKDSHDGLVRKFLHPRSLTARPRKGWDWKMILSYWELQLFSLSTAAPIEFYQAQNQRQLFSLSQLLLPPWMERLSPDVVDCGGYRISIRASPSGNWWLVG